MTPSMTLKRTTSFCEKVYTKASTYPSTFAVNGRTQAVRTHEQSFSQRPTSSIPTTAYTGVLRRFVAILSIQSGMRLSPRRQIADKRRYANGAICIIRVTFRSVFTKLLTAPCLWSGLSICQSL